MNHPRKIPNMVYASDSGEIIDIAGLEMAGRSGDTIVSPKLSDLIPLPEGSELFVLPARYPVGIDSGGNTVTIYKDPCKQNVSARAVAAFIAPAHTGIYTAAYKNAEGTRPTLPLFAYTAVGWLNNRFWVTAFRSDPDIRQDAAQFNPRLIKIKTLNKLKKSPDNRLVQHVGKCCLTYGCPAAKNYFLGRWEAPIPTSPKCNAYCVGCISLQASGCCPSTQERIAFVPSKNEIVEMAIPHLKKAPKPVVSFGQGCEGEPLIQAPVLETAIRKIRQGTSRGTINLNTNASLPDSMLRLAHSGLNSVRISLNSARPDKYALYYRPRGYTFEDVKKSIHVMKRLKKFVSLNYFIFPGFTDHPDEITAFCNIIEDFKPDLIQLRNLNMDPDWYLETVRYKSDQRTAGIPAWLVFLKKNFPWLKFGYFNPYLKS